MLNLMSCIMVQTMQLKVRHATQSDLRAIKNKLYEKQYLKEKIKLWSVNFKNVSLSDFKRRIL